MCAVYENAPRAESEGYVGWVGFWRVAVRALVAFGDEGLGAVVCRGVLENCPVTMINVLQGTEHTEHVGAPCIHRHPCAFRYEVAEVNLLCIEVRYRARECSQNTYIVLVWTIWSNGDHGIETSVV